MLTRLFLIAGTICALASPSALLAQEAPGGGDAPPTPVTVVTLRATDVTLTTSLPGRVLASAQAELRPQVNGIIVQRLFEEGSQVAEDDPLYRIDPRSYEAAVAQAEATLTQAQAQADAARRDAERIDALRDRRVASEQSQDTAIAARDAAEAAVRVAEAQLLSARIDLDRTTVRAPIAGVIGLAQSSQGALATASQADPLAVIRSIDPVHVDVTQSAADIVRWRRLGPEAALPPDMDRTVSLRLADGSIYEHTGSLTAAEPHVDEMTGVVTLRMAFDNPDGFLLPGMYVQADIPQAHIRNAVLAPQEGVTRDRRGRPVALVVNDDNIVEERLLDIQQDHGNQWVVSEGLADGDRIIVEGVQRIGPGMTVAPEERAARQDAAGAGAADDTAEQPAENPAEDPAEDATGQPDPATDPAAD
ncbi:membrane fusion protein, multidrug efflux system [Paracoccus alcaliphilus]|uniref:Membrane fusion protein, multidrug efflux system n=1 Tax=Paracoccus alcaliphilus TaxID=34002 RepID=A0A1H8DXR9_9RHOB|nr:efflux RND transporter periplasmic adaptor subunit [Paracoccus alcaliphilus]WCR16871.1 efflux RND transporter periplasmic adaptor subunit [Paracoccus alcaliphilus]SEN11980.1 membrane fusion protein, multidrug efflux system [Paracoccus alcaliphilus]